MYATKNIEKWIGYDFEPVECKTGDDFSLFVRNLKSEIKAQLKDTGCTVVEFSKGYFFVSGFVCNERNGKYIYFSIDDVRFSKNWHEKILVRRVHNEKDYRGDNNNYTSLENFKGTAIGMLENGYSRLAA